MKIKMNKCFLVERTKIRDSFQKAVDDFFSLASSFILVCLLFHETHESLCSELLANEVEQETSDFYLKTSNCVEVIAVGKELKL